MRTSTKGLLATLIIVSTLTLGACQEQKQTQAQADQAKTLQTAQTQTQTVADKKLASQDETITPDGWVVADTETFIPVVDKLGKHLSQARRDYLKGDNMAAAVAMREGSAFLKQELPQADKQGQTALKQASDDLMKNASLVQMGEIDSVKDLDRVFAKAYQADTEHLWLVADEEEWIPVIEKPQQHWQVAKDYYLDKDNQAAAREIDKGIAFLNLEANRTTDKDLKSKILDSVQNLEQLAKNVREGKVDNVERLNRAFAGGQLAMGQFYESKAQASESQGKLTTAGNEIIGAFHHLEAANNWLGGDKVNLEQAKTDIDAVRNSLGSPNETLSRNLNSAIATVGEQLTTLNGNLAQS
jgi:hypothetical protein